LVVSGGSECIRRADHDLVALALDPVRKLADRGRLSHAVYADDHHHVWLDFKGNLSLGRNGAPTTVLVGGLQSSKEFRPDQPLQFLSVGELVAAHLLPHFVDDLCSSLNAQVGANKGLFQLVEHIPVDFALARYYGVYPVGQVLTGRCDSILELLKERRLFFDWLLGYGPLLGRRLSVESQRYVFVFLSLPE